MKNYTLPYFGELNLEDLEEYYDVEIDFDDRKIELDLNFGDKTIDPARLDVVRHFIDNLDKYNSKNYAAIKSDFKDGDTVEEYINHHMDIGEDGLSTIIDFANKKISPEKQMLSKIHLVRVGIYPEGEDQFAIFDYSIGRELTQYLIVLFTDEKGKLDYMTMES
jgi:hypothetical protein